MGVENQKYGEDGSMNSEFKILKNLDNQKDKNELFEKIKNNLDKPNKVSRSLVLVENEVGKITKKEDIQYYKDFLNTVQNNIKDKLPTGNMNDFSTDTKEKIDADKQYIEINKIIGTMLGSLSQKEQEFLAQEKSTTHQDDNVKKIDKPEVSVGNVDGLKNSLRNLQSNEIIEFKGVIDNLKNGLLTSEKIPQFASMMNILRSMNGLSKDQIMSVVENVITTKFSNQKDAPEITGFKEILSVVLDKGLVGKFITTVDEDLNKNKDLQGTSYDVLLDSKTDLSSKEAKAGILNIFNNNEDSFNKLVTDFADQNKKTQVEKIVKEYIIASIPDGDNPSKADINSAIVSIDKNFIVDGGEKPAFIMTKLDGSPLGIAQKDPNGDIVKDKEGKDVLSQRFTPFFGDAIHGKKLSPDQYMKPEMMQQLLGKDSLKMEGVASVMKELVSVNGKKLSFADAITSLFNSPLFDQIKQAFYTLIAMFGKEDSQEKAMIEANYLTLKGDIRKFGHYSYKDKDGKDQSISYIDALNKFEPGVIKDGENYKAIFLGLSTENQKQYIETAVTSGRDLAYVFLESIKGKKKVETNTTNEDKENKNAVVLVEGKETTIGEHKVIKQGDYYLIDGKPSDGTIFIKDADGKLTKKTLKLDNTDFESQDVMLTPNETIATLYPKNSEALPQGKEDIFRYYALESSGDLKNPNPIDELLNLEKKPEGVDKIIISMKKKLTGLDSTKRTKEEIQKIFQEGLNELQGIDMGDNKTQYNTALNKRATAVGIETSNIATLVPKFSTTSKKTS